MAFRPAHFPLVSNRNCGVVFRCCLFPLVFHGIAQASSFLSQSRGLRTRLHVKHWRRVLACHTGLRVRCGVIELNSVRGVSESNADLSSLAAFTEIRTWKICPHTCTARLLGAAQNLGLQKDRRGRAQSRASTYDGQWVLYSLTSAFASETLIHTATLLSTYQARYISHFPIC